MIFSSFAPVVALFLIPVKSLNSKKAFFIIQSLTLSFFIYVLFFLPYLPSKTMPMMLSLYPLSLFLFNLILIRKFKICNFSRILAVSIMLAYVLTELHELPAFLYSFVHLSFLIPEKLIFSIAPIYALVVFWLAARSFNLHLVFWEKVLMLLSIMGLFGFYLINPLIDINGDPTVWAYLARIYCFAILAAAFYLRGNPGGSANG